MKILCFSLTNSSTRPKNSLLTIKLMHLSEFFPMLWALCLDFLSTRGLRKLKLERKITWKLSTKSSQAQEFKFSCIYLDSQSCSWLTSSSSPTFPLLKLEIRENQHQDTWFLLPLVSFWAFLSSSSLVWFKEKTNSQLSSLNSSEQVSGPVWKECPSASYCWDQLWSDLQHTACKTAFTLISKPSSFTF